jgi:hypothetical protein
MRSGEARNCHPTVVLLGTATPSSARSKPSAAHSYLSASIGLSSEARRAG